MWLIDFDDGVELKSKLLFRTLVFDEQISWFQALLYPNALRANGKLYTKVQLSAFVFLARSIMGLIEDFSKDKRNGQIKLGEELRKNDMENWHKDGVPR